jgi:hypothetical protein
MAQARWRSNRGPGRAARRTGHGRPDRSRARQVRTGEVINDPGTRISRLRQVSTGHQQRQRRCVEVRLEEVELNVGVYATQASWVGTEGWPGSGLCDVDNVSGAAVEDIGGQEQLVDLAGGGSVEFARDY